MTELELGAEVTVADSAGEAETIAAMLRSCGVDANAEVRRAGARRVAVYVRSEDLDLARSILEAPISEDTAT